MKDIITNLDVFTLVKLEARAARAKMSLARYVSLFLADWVEPIKAR